jgi:hypothetical protein
MSLSALQIFLSLKGKSRVEADSTTPESTESSNEPRKNEEAKKEQNPDSFESSASQAETPETQATKPQTWLEQIVNTGKKAFDAVSEQTGKIISVTKNLWDNLPKKFKTAQEEHDKRVTQIQKDTEEAKKIAQETPEKIEDKEDSTKLSPLEIKRILRHIYYERQQEAKREQARLEASRQEQARLLREIEARRQAEIRAQESSLLSNKKKTENKKETKTEIAKTILMKDLINRYSSALFGFEITKSTTEGQLINFLMKSNHLSLVQKKEMLNQSGKQDQLKSIISNDAIAKLVENKSSGLSYSA